MLTFPPDISFVVQIISFLLLWFGLKRLLFDPILQVLETRHARTVGTSREAAEIRAAADLAAADYERRMQEVRRTLGRESEAARAETQTEERRLLAEARERANTQLQQLRESLARRAAAARPALASEARELAARVIERVVGRSLA